MIGKNPTQLEIKESLNNPTKQRIIKKLKANGSSSFGAIIMDLSLSAKAGVIHIVELKNMGIINHINNSSLLVLNQTMLDSLITDD